MNLSRHVNTNWIILKEMNLESRSCYYFHDITNYFDLDNILRDEKLNYANISILTFRTKVCLLLNLCELDFIK